MAETIEGDCGGEAKWHWYNIMNDLEVQGGLDGVSIDPLSIGDHSCGGETKKGTKFHFTWLHGKFLLVSMTQEEQELVEAFAKVVEYRPFCRYLEKGFLTFEWDTTDPTGRFAELQNDNKDMLQMVH